MRKVNPQDPTVLGTPKESTVKILIEALQWKLSYLVVLLSVFVPFFLVLPLGIVKRLVRQKNEVSFFTWLAYPFTSIWPDTRQLFLQQMKNYLLVEKEWDIRSIQKCMEWI